MDLVNIIAQEVLEGDQIILAGRLYKVGIVNTYMNDTVGIQLSPAKPGSRVYDLLNLSCSVDTPIQVLR